MKSDQDKKILLKILKQTPIVQIACEKAGVGRATYYRWRKEDEEFKKESNKALREGVGYINDLAESQLLIHLKQGNLQALRYWLSHRNKKYNPKVQLEGNIELNRKITQEEKDLIKEALRLANINQNDGVWNQIS